MRAGGCALDWSRIGVEAITGLEAGTSPLIGWGERATSAARFVVTTGGKYVFMPGIRPLRWLAHLPEHQP